MIILKQLYAENINVSINLDHYTFRYLILKSVGMHSPDFCLCIYFCTFDLNIDHNHDFLYQHFKFCLHIIIEDKNNKHFPLVSFNETYV